MAALNGLDDRIVCFNAQIGSPDLGLSSEELAYIRENLTLVIHAAWAVNFSLPLCSFVKDHIAGLHNLINLAQSCTNRVSFSFCSSTASALGPFRPSTIPEIISTSPIDADSLGYSRSKWVAEALCSRASTASRRIQINVLRIGQLTGDTENGVWNMSEAWPLMLSTVDTLGCLPRLKEPLSWLPLNVAAEAVVEIATSDCSVDGNNHDRKESEYNCSVYHVVNNSQTPVWEDLLHWLRQIRKPKEDFEIVELGTWLEKLEALESHPAKNLLGLWRTTYGNEQPPQEAQSSAKSPMFSIERAEKAPSAMRHVKGVDEALFRKIWAWIKEEIRQGAET